jgi:hypothetical protein
MRTSMRRFTRLANARWKELGNHAHMIALYFMHYNYSNCSNYRKIPRAA